MKKIVLIIPYFGKLPNSFKYWLISAKYNATIDFFIYTDNPRDVDCPQNVIWKQMKFEEIQKRLSEKIGFEANLKNAYKLCDVKPAYGDIFASDISDYDFWGWCDIDLVFGNIRHFITDELLSEYEKIGYHGHFTLIKNTDKMRKMYLQAVGKEFPYKTVYKCGENLIFDEGGVSGYGFPVICEQNNVKSIWKRWFTDVYTETFEFKSKDYDENGNLYWRDFSHAEFNEGKLAIWHPDNNSYQESLYIHFQGRKMVAQPKAVFDVFFMVPNRFLCELSESSERNVIDDKQTHVNIKRRRKRKSILARLRLLMYFSVRPAKIKSGWIRVVYK